MSGSDPQGPHRRSLFSVVQPGRAANFDRECRQIRRKLGMPEAVMRSSPSKGTPIGSGRRRSARTGRGSRPRVGTRRPRFGTPEWFRALTLKHSNFVHRRSIQPGWIADRHSERDNTAKIWDAATGAVILTLRGHHHPVYGVIQPRRLRVATASIDGSAGSGTPRAAIEVLTLKALLLRLFVVVQPGWVADRDRGHAAQTHGLGRETRR